jgi:hypothetical protein
MANINIIYLAKLLISFFRKCKSVSYLFCEIIFTRLQYGEGKILFIHGSTGDIFIIAGFIDEYVKRNGGTIIWCVDRQSEIFKKFSSEHGIKYKCMSFDRCSNLYNALVRVDNFWKIQKIDSKFNPRNFIIMCNLNLHKKIAPAVLENNYSNGGITYLQAMRLILSLPTNVIPKDPKYSNKDKNIISDLFIKIKKPLSNLAVINIVCYTHANISSDAWQSIAKAIELEGYSVVFNIASNFGSADEQMRLVPDGYPKVIIPAYLLPLVGNLVGLVCSRWGGGFILLQGILNSNRSLLVLLEAQSDSNKLPDPDPIFGIRVMNHIYGKNGNNVSHYVLLKGDDSMDLIYEKSIKALKEFI